MRLLEHRASEFEPNDIETARFYRLGDNSLELLDYISDGKLIYFSNDNLCFFSMKKGFLDDPKIFHWYYQGLRVFESLFKRDFVSLTKYQSTEEQFWREREDNNLGFYMGNLYQINEIGLLALVEAKARIEELKVRRAGVERRTLVTKSATPDTIPGLWSIDRETNTRFYLNEHLGGDLKNNNLNKDRTGIWIGKPNVLAVLLTTEQRDEYTAKLTELMHQRERIEQETQQKINLVMHKSSQKIEKLQQEFIEYTKQGAIEEQGYILEVEDVQDILPRI